MKKIIILVNEQTSGVSELLIRMIQKGSQVEILGKPTVGAQLIMRFFPLSNGKYLFFQLDIIVMIAKKLIKNTIRRNSIQFCQILI
ncbi:MAG: hypothetical protein IPL69_00915 [Saprospiraceae bacterium]|nr:hypothetical protein [Candidatus Brachybacter algidus]